MFQPIKACILGGSSVTSSSFHPNFIDLDKAMEKADDPRVQWRVVVAAMPRTSVGCSKNLTEFRWWERKVQHKPQAGRIRIRYSGVLTNKTNIKCVCMLLRVYVIKSVYMFENSPSRSRHSGGQSWQSTPLRLPLPPASWNRVRCSSFNHSSWPLHPAITSSVDIQKQETYPSKDAKRWSFHHKSGENKQVWSRQNFFFWGGRGCRSVCSYGHRSWPRGFVAVKEWKESGPDLKASWIK